jgi:hypothetical protein
MGLIPEGNPSGLPWRMKWQKLPHLTHLLVQKYPLNAVNKKIISYIFRNKKLADFSS